MTLSNLKASSLISQILMRPASSPDARISLEGSFSSEADIKEDEAKSEMGLTWQRWLSMTIYVYFLEEKIYNSIIFRANN